MSFRESILNYIPAGKWVKGQELCRMAGITEPYSSAARKLGYMVNDGDLKYVPSGRGSFFALPDAPDIENEMQRRAVLSALAGDAGRSAERIAKMSGLQIEQVSGILDEWVAEGYVEKYYGSYSLKLLFRLLERPQFKLIVETAPKFDAWRELNALFVEMAKRGFDRNPYAWMR